TGFGTDCDGFNFANTYVIGDPLDPCGTTSGAGPGDWFDADGALSSSGNTPPTITAPATANGTEGTAISTITATATDPEAGQTLTASDPDNDALTFGIVAGPTYMSLVPVDGTHTTVRLVPGFTSSGTASATIAVGDGSASNQKTFTITVNNVNRAPVLTQPSN